MGNRVGTVIPDAEKSAFSNFLKIFKKTEPALTEDELIKSATNAWGKLTPNQKAKFMDACKGRVCPRNKVVRVCKPRRNKTGCGIKRRVVLGCRGKPKPTKRSCRPAKRRCPRKKPKKPACARPKKTCGKPKKARCMVVPVMSNGYLNFMREFQRKNVNLKPQSCMKKGARLWLKLSKSEQDKYRQERANRK